MLHLPNLASEPSFALPRISAFYGIAIYMYYRDHPPPHLHARYGGDEAEMAIGSSEIIAGALPKRAERLVAEWIDQHRADLMENWRRARQHERLHEIEPLD